eukprot:CAMPEP_0171468528 /NCGR_PEP_ID=MMETSP0945-20130129/10654_1 /TAXON_ID=109269 /ORGANISM="Vaucheria litorea, Strain CCMP2940" /LENGTH=89 /DNA_ID=CAMNT_0011997321 /DNA_START=21 /DNA_END=287 /DNA_ORIENTATION=-
MADVLTEWHDMRFDKEGIRFRQKSNRAHICINFRSIRAYFLNEEGGIESNTKQFQKKKRIELPSFPSSMMLPNPKVEEFNKQSLDQTES